MKLPVRGRSKGLGDTVHKLTTATGISRVVSFISHKTGIPCGCAERRERWNQMFPYKPYNDQNCNDTNTRQNPIYPS